MIYVLGSINTDMVARVSRMPVSGETITAEKFYCGQGGKGANQAVAIGKLGGKVAMIGKVGDDAFGESAAENLKGFGVDVSRVKTEKGVSTGLAMIIVEKGDNRIILEPGANHRLTESDVDEGLSDAKRGDFLIMQLEIPLSIVEYAAKRGKEKGMTVLLNPAPAVKLPPSLLENVDIIAPNESETEILTGVNPNKGDVELALAVKTLYGMGVGRVIITLGSRGAAVAEGQTITYIEPRKVKVVDTTSAGDTFIGACALRLTAGDTLTQAARFSNVASSITITREGAAASIPTLDEVNEIILKEQK